MRLRTVPSKAGVQPNTVATAACKRSVHLSMSADRRSSEPSTVVETLARTALAMWCDLHAAAATVSESAPAAMGTFAQCGGAQSLSEVDSRVSKSYWSWLGAVVARHGSGASSVCQMA